jgi:LPXTG-motif cell wall-anchored protein
LIEAKLKDPKNTIPQMDKGENKMNSKASWTRAWLALAVGTVGLALTLSATAQVETTTTTTAHKASVQTTVESGEVVYVSGNDLVVKASDGSIRHFANVPESVRITVDGQQLGIHDLKPGMKLQRTITTTTTPKTITVVKSVTGTVWYISPPSTVILKLDDGSNQKFTIPKGQKFNIDGQMVDAWGLKKGMKVSATKVVEEPIVDVSQSRSVTGQMPPPPPPPPDVPILVVYVPAPAPAPAAVAAAAPAPELPKTGSELPLIGLLGFLALASSATLRMARKIR